MGEFEIAKLTSGNHDGGKTSLQVASKKATLQRAVEQTTDFQIYIRL
jgi:hypothetical protein